MALSFVGCRAFRAFRKLTPLGRILASTKSTLTASVTQLCCVVCAVVYFVQCWEGKVSKTSSEFANNEISTLRINNNDKHYLLTFQGKYLVFGKQKCFANLFFKLLPSYLRNQKTICVQFGKFEKYWHSSTFSRKLPPQFQKFNQWSVWHRARKKLLELPVP